MDTSAVEVDLDGQKANWNVKEDPIWAEEEEE